MPPNAFSPDYAPRQKWHQRRLWCRVVFSLLGVLILLTCMMLYKFGPDTWNHMLMIHAQSRCADFQLEPNTWVYVEDTPTATELLRDRAYEKLAASGVGATHVFRKSPSFWEDYRRFVLPLPMMYPPNPEMTSPGTLLFLHRRTTVTGKDRIVAIWLQLVSEPQDEFTRFSVSGRVFIEGTWMEWPSGNTLFSKGQDGDPNDPYYMFLLKDKLRFAAGQPDSTDASKFYVPWEYKGERHTATGTIVDNDDEDVGVVFVHLKLEGLP